MPRKPSEAAIPDTIRSHAAAAAGGGASSWPAATFWMAAAFAAALGLTVAVFALVGVEQRGTDAALLVTARFSFMLFWPAYAGGAMAALFGARFHALKAHARNFGLAFASAHLVHLGLVGWLCWIGAVPAVGTFVFFGTAAVWVYLLALLSIDRLHRAVGRIGWRLLSLVGLNFIAFAFAVDFLQFPPRADARYIVFYLPFVMLAIAGPVLRVIAWARQTLRRTC
jgi:hypothetical protein